MRKVPDVEAAVAILSTLITAVGGPILINRMSVHKGMRLRKSIDETLSLANRIDEHGGDSRELRTHIDFQTDILIKSESGSFSNWSLTYFLNSFGPGIFVMVVAVAGITATAIIGSRSLLDFHSAVLAGLGFCFGAGVMMILVFVFPQMLFREEGAGSE